jgi:hypothetical protein
VDPFRAVLRNYNVDLAVSAAKPSFDEVQFDYVRFPDAKGANSPNRAPKSLGPRHNGFLKKARDTLVRHNVSVAADLLTRSRIDMRSCDSRSIALNNGRELMPCVFGHGWHVFADYAFDKRQLGRKERWKRSYKKQRAHGTSTQ